MDKITEDLIQTHIREGETAEQAVERVKREHAAVEKCFICGKDRNGAPNLLYDRFTKKFKGICGHCARMR
jgi:hypothetical protein